MTRKERIESEKIPFTFYIKEWYSDYGRFIIWGILLGNLLTILHYW
ncbi:hypothetical protein V7124_25060 [Neobacillus niacini]